MPLIGAGGTIALEAHNCLNWETLDDLAEMIQSIANDLHLICLDPSTPLEIGENGRQVHLKIDPIDISNYLKRSIQELSNWNRPEFGVSTYDHVRIWFRPPFIRSNGNETYLGDDFPIMAQAFKYGEEYSFIRIRAEISPRTAFDQSLREAYAEEAAQLFIAVADKVSERLRPEYQWCGEDDEYSSHIFGEQVISRSINTIYWMNNFTSSFFSEQQLELFKNPPVGFSKIEGGKIWYQLHQSFDLGDRELMQEIEDQALEHFSKLGIERVQWTYQI